MFQMYNTISPLALTSNLSNYAQYSPLQQFALTQDNLRDGTSLTDLDSSGAASAEGPNDSTGTPGTGNLAADLGISGSTLGGLIGTAASLASGIPGVGLAGSFFGAMSDQNAAQSTVDAAYGGKGSGFNLDSLEKTLEAALNSATFGLAGYLGLDSTKSQQDKALNAIGMEGLLGWEGPTDLWGDPTYGDPTNDGPTTGDPTYDSPTDLWGDPAYGDTGSGTGSGTGGTDGSTGGLGGSGDSGDAGGPGGWYARGGLVRHLNPQHAAALVQKWSR